MSEHHYTPAEYAMQQIVKSLGNLIYQLEEARLTLTYWVVFHFCDQENIEYPVLRLLNIGALPFEEFTMDLLFDGVTWSSSIWVTVVGDDLIWQLLQEEGKWLSFGKRRGETETTR